VSVSTQDGLRSVGDHRRPVLPDKGCPTQIRRTPHQPENYRTGRGLLSGHQRGLLLGH
jgi:hypothetical protein